MKNKIIKNFLLIDACLLMTEIISRLILKFNIFNWSIIRIIISLSALSLIISVIISFIPNKITKWINCFIAFLSSIYVLIQIGLYNFIGVFFSLNSSSQAEKITDYVMDYIKGYSWDYYLVFIPFILIILYYIFLDKKILSNKKISKKGYLITLGVVVALLGCFYATTIIPFMQNKYQSESNIDLLKYCDNPNLTVNQFGVNTYAIIDFVSLFTEEKVVDMTNNTDTEVIVDNSRELDDTAWKEIIESETSQTKNQINNYLINRAITPKNEKTGFFVGKNLIAILLESVNNVPLLYPEYFPTINKLYNEGWSWENSYTPRNSCSTGNNEMMFLTSLYTINNSCTANTYKNNKYMQSMFNLFNEAGYYTSSYHDYADAYYYRNTIHTNMGVKKYYNASKLDIKVNSAYAEWPSDTELFSKSVDKYINEDKFFTFYSTVTTHRPYSSSEFGNKNLDMFKDLDMPIENKRYLSKMKELDDGLSILLTELEKVGKLDNTVIVLFADHYPYGLSNNSIKKFLGEEALVDYERDRTPFIIYNSQLTAESFDDYTSIVNALPTVANLFDLNFDPRYYMGTDLFSDEYESKVVFSDGSWRNENIMYNASTNNIKYYNDVEIDDSIIVETNNKITNDIKMSNMMIKNNYFNYLNSKLTEKLTPAKEE